MILVTGGTGLVGSHLLYKLIANGKQVRATYRKAYKLDRVKHVFSYYTSEPNEYYDKIEWVETDITDIPKLNVAFKGVTQVYHCAAFVSFEPDKYKTLRKINIEGTANVVNQCIHHNIKKLCYVSSIAALGHQQNPDQLITEQTAWNPEADNSVYAITKYGAELEVWRGTQEGVPSIVVNPGIILGAGHWNGGSSGRLFKRVYEGLSYYTEGVTGYIDVNDVVDIMTSLMESPIENEGYILVAENLSFKSFLFKSAKALQVNPPLKAAKAWQLELAWRVDWINSKLFGKRRTLSKQSTKSLRAITKYDQTKVKTALNYTFKPIDTSIEAISRQFLKDSEY
jgi:dihydroflavonol-4-reductase